jgi:carbamoyltransferase
LHRLKDIGWGARALGNRGILADPGRADARDRVNERVKYREEFRPFAPSIREEAVDECFTGHTGPYAEDGDESGPAPDPFMQQVYPVREDKQTEAPPLEDAGSDPCSVVEGASL